MNYGYRILFSVGEVGRYISHLDILRTVQRAIKRSRLPIVYSAGFNPTPKMAFASALPVGITSESEYLDIAMENEILVSMIQERLNSTLPGGFNVIEVKKLPDNALPLMTIIKAASYFIDVISGTPNLAMEIEKILEAKTLIVERQLRGRKKGIKEIEIRKLIYQLEYNEQSRRIYLKCASGINGNLRPMELLPILGLRLTDVLIHRTALWTDLADKGFVTPFQVIKE